MSSQTLIDHAEKRLREREGVLGARLGALREAAADLPADEAALLLHFSASLPVSDVLDADPSTLVGFARHAAMLRRELRRVAALPEDVFVADVAAPRINNEPLVDCRGALWERLRDRVAGLSEPEVVREVNYWCAEHATYQSTDGRTLGPLGVLAAGHGRCGEESTLLVSALRSVGVPARQIYVPLWAHCDDNHAWVEAYADGAWHYLGACEPEEALDRGWFTAASGRAPRVQAMLFTDYGREGLLREGCTWIEDRTAGYAPTATLEARVSLPDGSPAADATVTAEVLNSAQWGPVCTLATDAAGRCRAETGLCTLRLTASLGGLVAQADVDVAEGGTIAELRLGRRACGDGWRDLDVRAPQDHPAPCGALTPQMEERGRKRRAEADRLRRARVAAMADHARELAAEAVRARPGDDAATVARVLVGALGNADEVLRFLCADDGPDRLALLAGLAPKDWLDLDADVLEGHLTAARTGHDDALARLRAQGLDADAAQRAWERGVLCPRIGLEHLSAWRPRLAPLMGDELRRLVLDDPRAAWARLEKGSSFSLSQDLAKLVGTPQGALASGHASSMTLRTLFVACCRTMGVAARLASEDLAPEFMADGRWQRACPAAATDGSDGGRGAAGGRHVLCVTSEAAELRESHDWGLSRLGAVTLPGGRAHTGWEPLWLDEAVVAPGRPLRLELEPGTYRLTTTVRLPDGDQQASQLDVVLDGDAEVALRVRTPDVSDLLQDVDLSGTCPERLLGRDLGLLAFLRPAAEPTEHLLNELGDAAGRVSGLGVALRLVVPCGQGGAADEDPTLRRALASLRAAGARVEVVEEDFSELPERIARRMFANPEELPLAVLADARGDAARGLFARGGYAVGTVDLALRLAALA